MKKNLLASVAALGLGALSAQADGVEFASGYGSLIFDDSDSGSAFNGEVDYVRGRLSFTAEGTLLTENSYEISALDLSAGVEVAPGVSLYVHSASIGGDFFPDADFYGFGAEYRAEDFGVGVRITDSSSEELKGANRRVFTAAGFYQASETTSVYGAFSDQEFSQLFSVGVSYETDSYDLAGAFQSSSAYDEVAIQFGGMYHFGGAGSVSSMASGMSLGGNYLFQSDDFSDGFLSLAAEYDLNPTTTLGLGYFKFLGDSESSEMFSLTVEFSTGGDRARVFDQIGDAFKNGSGQLNAAMAGDVFDFYTPGLMPFGFGPN